LSSIVSGLDAFVVSFAWIEIQLFGEHRVSLRTWNGLLGGIL